MRAPATGQRLRRPRGRRPGSSDSREAIAAAALRLFADHGYDGVSIRAIARSAGVDPALVTYFYGSKRGLFEGVLRLPVDPAVVAELMQGRADEVGFRLARFVVAEVKAPDTEQVLMGLLRTATSDPEAARLFRERYLRSLLEPLATAIRTDHPTLRAALCSSQLMGLAVALKVFGLPALVEAETDVLAEVYGATLQRYLTGPLPAALTAPGAAAGVSHDRHALGPDDLTWSMPCPHPTS